MRINLSNQVAKTKHDLGNGYKIDRFDIVNVPLQNMQSSSETINVI